MSEDDLGSWIKLSAAAHNVLVFLETRRNSASKENAEASHLENDASAVSGIPGGLGGGRDAGFELDSDGEQAGVTAGSLSPEGRELTTTPPETEAQAAQKYPSDAGASQPTQGAEPANTEWLWLIITHPAEGRD
jgi:hypothetical protein